MSDCELTILMPCLDEARTVGICVAKARRYLESSGINGEILVADNGSTDGSQGIARAEGARIVDVADKGYGNALIGGIRAARGKYVIMGDCDDSYDFIALAPFVEKLRAGYELVMGNRFKGGIKPGAMPFLHRYLGNPGLTLVGRIFFGCPSGDFQCGLRGFSRESIVRLNLQTPGMEFSTEMVVKATMQDLRIIEVPTTLSPDGRGRPPHLRTWRDGWRYLRFMLLFSPRWLFLLPGLLLFTLGLLGTIILSLEHVPVGGVVFGIHTLFYSSISMMIGFHCVLFWLFARMYIMREGLVPKDKLFEKIVAASTLERGLIISALLILTGIGLSMYALDNWRAEHYGRLQADDTMRLVIPAGTIILIGAQLAFGSFFLSVLEFRTHSYSSKP
jgi:glycosyltransferase involved in cell wall biosynthesis